MIHSPRSFRSVALSALLLMVLFALPASAEERWFHVHVTEDGGDNANVVVNLPLSLIESALKLIPAEVHEEMQIELEDMEIELADLREFWREMKDQDDAVFVTVDSDDESVRVSKEGDYLVARTTERSDSGTEVDVRLPFSVLDGLFADEETIDLAGAIRALAENGDGDIVSVNDGDTRVRVWVDSSNESEV
jgi:hypothetical protein